MKQPFVEASRLKVRYATSRGNLTVEDLWDLPLTSATGKINLNDIAKSLNKQLKNEEEEDFVVTKPKAKNKTLIAAFEVVKVVITTKVEENATEKARKDKAATKKRILEIISQKEDETLGSKSVAELQDMLKDY